MQIAIITSTTDLASQNMRQTMLEQLPFIRTEEEGEQPVYTWETKHTVELHGIEEDMIHAEYIDQDIQADLFIFASKHQSKKAVPTLSVHALGNWTKAKYGGEDRTLNRAPAIWIKRMLQLMEEENDTSFDVVQEATHHGPAMGTPAMFIEIGSTEASWKNPDAANVMIRSLERLLTEPLPECKVAVGIGGLHTTPNFKKIQLSTDIAVGHILAKYALEHLNHELLDQSIQHSRPQAELILLDYKGLGQHKQAVKDLVKSSELPVKRTQHY